MQTNLQMIQRIDIPANLRKRTTIASCIFYDSIEIYKNRVIGYSNGQSKMTWYFKDYSGIDIVKANLNSQFAQVVFLTGINSKNRVTGIDFTAAQNLNAMNDTNRILLCGGMFSYSAANEFANSLGSKINRAFDEFKNNENEVENNSSFSVADEIKKFKDLLDSGVITQDEFDSKKKQLLNL